MYELNERQEKFCQEIMQGKTQRQAYYSAYPSSLKWKPATVDNKASELSKKDEILDRLDELRAITEKENSISRNDIIEHLKKIGFTDIDSADIRAADAIKALEVLIKILGYDKSDISENDNTIKIILERKNNANINS